jgi:2-oxoglutarate dehydrogenase complex dehydrogenase (E1) component-like enzyme
VRVTYIGRTERASPAEGYKASHDVEQQRIVAAVTDMPQPSTRKRSGAVRT